MTVRPPYPEVPGSGYAVPPGAPPWPAAPPWPGPAWGPPPPAIPDGRPLAESWERLVAYLVDNAIVSAVTTPVSLAVIVVLLWPTIRAAVAAGAAGRTELTFPLPRYAAAVLAIVVLQAVVHFLYDGLYQSRRGQTVGKRLLKIAVVRLDGAPVTVGVTVRRWAVQFVLASVVPLLSLVNSAWLLWDRPYRQCLHDKAAGTAVIKVAP